MLVNRSKNIIKFITVVYVLIIFFMPYALSINVREINGFSSFIDKILQNTNLIPLKYNYNINMDIIIKNVVIKILMFMPLGLFLKKQYSFKEALVLFLIIAVVKEFLHLVTFVGYFDINDFILYFVGFLIGWKLGIGDLDKKLIMHNKI